MPVTRYFTYHINPHPPFDTPPTGNPSHACTSHPLDHTAHHLEPLSLLLVRPHSLHHFTTSASGARSGPLTSVNVPINTRVYPLDFPPPSSCIQGAPVYSLMLSPQGSLLYNLLTSPTRPSPHHLVAPNMNSFTVSLSLLLLCFLICLVSSIAVGMVTQGRAFKQSHVVRTEVPCGLPACEVAGGMFPPATKKSE